MQLIREWLGNGWASVLVVLGLGLIIFIHELGHFIMAKKNKVKVEIFSLGFAFMIPRMILWKRTWGGTEYRICAFPFGGYVKMTGETAADPDRKGAAGELMSKTPWERFQIYVAGALMNLLIAFPIGILAYGVGKYEHTNEVGVPGVAETRGGLRPGDMVIEVDGRRIDSMDKFRIEMIRRPTGVVVPVKVLRGGREMTLKIRTMKSPYHQTLPAVRMLTEVEPGSPLALAGVKEGDELIRVNGEPVSGRSADVILRESPGKDPESLVKEFVLEFRRRELDFSDREGIVAKVTLPRTEWYAFPQDDHLVECRVASVVNGMPAFEALEPGDVIKKVTGKEIGEREIRSWQDLKDAVEPSCDKPLEFEVLREKEGKTFKATIVPAFNSNGLGGIGITSKASDVFAQVKPGSFYEKAGLRSGDVIYAIDGPTGHFTLANVLKPRDKAPMTVALQVKRAGQADPVPIKLVAEKVVEWDLAKAGFKTNQNYLVLADSYPKRKRVFGDAVRAGIWEPIDLTVMTFDVLRKLILHEESAKGLSGPAGIIHASFMFAKKSFGNFVWLLCLITVNLGIFNLLPIPLLDGGHNVLLLIEVVRKKLGKGPPSDKFVAGYQWSGLIFVAVLFLFVTWNDVARMFGLG